MSSVDSTYVLSEKDLTHIVACLSSMSYLWKELGIALGLSTTARSQCDNQRHIIALTNILTEWIVGANGLKPITLGTLQDKMRGPIVGQGRLAQGLLQAFNQERESAQQPSNGADASGNEPVPQPKKHCSGTGKITQVDQKKLVIPKSLEEKSHIEKYERAVEQILKKNSDILKKDLPSGEHLCKIAEKMGSDWRNKAYLLDLQRSDVDNITQGSNRDNPVGQRQEALETWRGRVPSPTYDNLLVILVKANWKEAQDELVRLCTK